VDKKSKLKKTRRCPRGHSPPYLAKNFIGYGVNDVEFEVFRDSVNVLRGLAGTSIISSVNGQNLIVSKKAISFQELKKLVGGKTAG
jgi:hypothetical protein